MRITTIVAIVMTLGLATTSSARPRPAGHIHGKRFEANKTFGLGLELGAPVGLNGKYFVADDRALDFGLGDIYNYGNLYGLHLYLDYLWHPVSLASADAFELPLYIGVGGRFWDFEYRGPRVYDHAYAFGVRVPVGIAFDFNNVPLDIFIQLVPTFDFFQGYAAHNFYLDINGSVGIRFWFD